ncbi:siderophore-interacting protein [Nocardia nova]|uniref:siderophore-interacting protein n=1 Tax=Nocardia nova TaxID=37330 RepID=UPI003402AAFA
MESIKAGIRQRALGNQLLSLELTVAQVDSVSPGFTRVTLEGDALAGYTDPRAADAFKLMLPADPGAVVDAPERDGSGLPAWSGETPPPVLRAFTVRRFDSAAQRLAFDVARHEQGVSIDWLASLRPGDTVALTGMRPEWALADSVTDHVLIGDRSAVPAIAAIIESLGPEHTVSAYVELPDPADIAVLPQHPNLTLREVADIGDAVHDTPSSIAAGRRTQVWIAAEAAQVRKIRAHATEMWGVDRADMLARAYWKLGITSTDNDSAELVEYQRAIADGADIYSPELAEAIELGV